MRLSPLLLLAGAGGMTGYFVGGAVGITSPTVLGAAVLALVLFLFVGHRAVESQRRRIRRVRRWSRNGVILGIALLLIALALYTSYTSDPSVSPIAHVQLDHATSLAPGENYTFTVNGATGDELYLLLGCSNPTSNVQGRFQTLDGSQTTTNVSAGTTQNPGFLPLSLQHGGGDFQVVIFYPLAASAPGPVTVNWTEGDIPAGIVATGAAAVPAGWTGFVLLIVGATIWVVSRPPDDTPAPSTDPSSGGPQAKTPAEPSSGEARPPPEATPPPEGLLLGDDYGPLSPEGEAGTGSAKVSDEKTT